MAQDNDQKTLNVPPLRFTGFTDEWKRSTLKDYLIENKERNSRGEFSKDEVLSVSGDKGIVNQIQLLGRSYAGQSVLPYHIVRRNNIVYTKSPLSEFPYGIVKMNRGKDGIVSTLYAVYSVLDSADPSFIEYYFASKDRTNRYFKPIVRIGAKHDMKIGNTEVLENQVNFPDKTEQCRISEFLELIDERIATQNKIIEDLKKLKSAIYENIFNTLEGDIYSLVDVADIIKGKQVNGEFLTETGDYYVMNGGVEPSGCYHTFNVSADTISISEGGNSCGYIQWNSVPFWSGGHCYTLNIKDESIKNKYLYHFLKWHEPKIMKLRIGSGLPNIQKKDLERVSIVIPTNSRQKEIIDLVDSIDGKIDTECSISLLLHHQKTYFLSKMFI